MSNSISYSQENLQTIYHLEDLNNAIEIYLK
jgi:hypothetical protein